MKQRLVGCKATNDYSESSLGGTTQEINKFGRIEQHEAAAVSNMQRNGYFDRKISGKRKSKEKDCEKGKSNNSLLIVDNNF